MTQLMITDIRKSSCDTRFDLITAIFLSLDGHETRGRRYLDERSVLVLESATAQEEIPAIGVRTGDQYIRLRAKPDHGLMVGDEIQFGKNRDKKTVIQLQQS
ncbi:MAG: hypothetical protein PHS80_09000 [Methanothrix sp.]|nr:hypothetical protein [Methanothrix sp.]